ncbi:hypothetical protein LXL04_034411 [Taraxacum kok-saghyz]
MFCIAGWLDLLMRRELISSLSSNYLRAITFVKHKGNISFSEQNLTKIIQPFKECKNLRRNWELLYLYTTQ